MVRAGEDDGAHATLLEVGPDCCAIVAFVGNRGCGPGLREIDQDRVGLRVVGFVTGEVEGERLASGRQRDNEPYR